MTEEVLAIEDLSTVKTTDEASATAAGKYEVIGREIDDKYIAQVKAQVVNQRPLMRCRTKSALCTRRFTAQEIFRPEE